MIVHRIVNFFFNSCTYVVHREESLQAMIVDCGDVEPIIDYLNENKLVLSHILLTHAHFDHIYGLNELLKLSPNALVYTNEAGRKMLLDARKNLSFYHETPFVFEYPNRIVVVADGDEVAIGSGLIAKAVFTPGHNLSCITWVVGDAVFSGDSLIPGVKTVANLPGGNRSQAVKSEEIIRQLAIGQTIYPGHKV